MQEIVAIYEKGVLKPLKPLNLQEKEKVTLKIIKKKSAVLATKGMIKGKAEFLEEIAQSKELEEWNL